MTELEQVYSPPLIVGRKYRFKEPICATGTPVGGREIFPDADLYFIEGTYVGADAYLNFKGVPYVDGRGLPSEDAECFFCVKYSAGLDAVAVELVDEGPE